MTFTIKHIEPRSVDDLLTHSATTDFTRKILMDHPEVAEKLWDDGCAKKFIYFVQKHFGDPEWLHWRDNELRSEWWGLHGAIIEVLHPKEINSVMAQIRLGVLPEIGGA